MQKEYHNESPFDNQAKATVPIPWMQQSEWPDVRGIKFACLANRGRSTMAEVITKDKIKKLEFPDVIVGSGSLLCHHPTKFKRADDRVREELRRHNHYGVQSSKPLYMVGISDRDDVILFVARCHIEAYLSDHYYSHARPRSIVSVNVPDPSEAKDPIQAISDTYDALSYFIQYQLLGIIANIRSGEYVRRHHVEKGIVYPFYDQPRNDGAVFGFGAL